jgi:hypothetical protein
MERKSVVTITFSGTVGSGKSTLLRAVLDHLRDELHLHGVEVDAGSVQAQQEVEVVMRRDSWMQEKALDSLRNGTRIVLREQMLAHRSDASGTELPVAYMRWPEFSEAFPVYAERFRFEVRRDYESFEFQVRMGRMPIARRGHELLIWHSDGLWVRI